MTEHHVWVTCAGNYQEVQRAAMKAYFTMKGIEYTPVDVELDDYSDIIAVSPSGLPLQDEDLQLSIYESYDEFATDRITIEVGSEDEEIAGTYVVDVCISKLEYEGDTYYVYCVDPDAEKEE